MLYQLGMKNASEVIVSGDSAGGLATLNWINYIRDYLPSTTFVYGFPDSGYFLDY